MVVPLKSRSDRLMARVAFMILSCGALYGIVSLSGPVYWRFYSTVVRPFYDKGSHNQTSLVMNEALGLPSLNFSSIKLDISNLSLIAVQSQNKTGATVPVIANLTLATEVKKPDPVAAPPPKPKEFNPEDYHLNLQLIAPHVEGGMLMITWANHFYLDFAKNWVFHLHKVGVANLMVGAMDDDMLRDLVALGIPTWRMNTNITKKDLGWGSTNFHNMGRAKIRLIHEFLTLSNNLTVIISDIDTAWMRNPLPYFQTFPDADILTSTDQLGPTVQDESLEAFPQAGASFNIGIMLFRPNSKDFVAEWVRQLVNPQMWDQTAFNDLARLKHSNSEPPRNLWKGYGGRLTFGVLPASIFCSGHTYFVQHKYREFGLLPYVAHATFQYSGTPGKRHRFREALLWDDPPEYFDPPGGRGFLHFDIAIPKELWDAAARPVQGSHTLEKTWDHFNLVNHQLQRLRTALALSWVTGRVLVLPPIWCQLDKYWAPLNDGNIPGTYFQKPFICPADHVLDLEGGWAPKRGGATSEWGPDVEYREYSFLQNPRLSAAVNDSRVTVHVCSDEEVAAGGCARGEGPGSIQDGVLRVAPSLNSAALAAALAPTGSARMLYFPSVEKAFGTFADPEVQRRFVHRLNHYTSVSCCLDNHQDREPGWIWYDFFSDVPDHRDRFGRAHPATEPGKRVVYLGDAGVRKELLDPAIAGARRKQAREEAERKGRSARADADAKQAESGAAEVMVESSEELAIAVAAELKN